MDADVKNVGGNHGWLMLLYYVSSVCIVFQTEINLCKPFMFDDIVQAFIMLILVIFDLHIFESG